MEELNNQLSGMNLDELRMAVDQQNNGVLKEMYSVMMLQQKQLDAQSKLVTALQENAVGVATLLDKIVAKLEVFRKMILKD